MCRWRCHTSTVPSPLLLCGVSHVKEEKHKAASDTREILVPHFEGEKFTPPFLALVSAVVGGLLFHLAFDPYGLWGLLPLALGALYFASFTRRWVVAFVSGLLFGTSAFIPLFSWASIYAGLGPHLALAVFEALFIAAFSVLARFILVRRGIRFSSSVGIACLWAMVEFARSSVPWGGLSWGMSAFAYAESPLLNFGPWLGVTGLGAVSGLLGAYVLSTACALTFRRARGSNGMHAVWPASVAIILVLFALVTPRPANSVDSGHHSIRVAGIQGNIERPKAGSYYIPDTMFANHVKQMREFLASGGHAQLVVWPEDSTGWDVQRKPERMEALKELADEAGAPILVGTQHPNGTQARFNTSVLVDEKGPTGQEYTKRHPVPFGEYIPQRDFFSKITDKVSLVDRDMTPGNKVGVLDVSGAKVGVLICFEIAYEQSVADTVNAGAELLVVQSNNALFLDSHESIQQLAQAKVLAVISGRSVVHVSTVGDSAIFTPEGRRLTGLDHWTEGSMVADVPVRTGLTPAMQHGDVIKGIIAALAGVVLLASVIAPPRTIKERRSRS